MPIVAVVAALTAAAAHPPIAPSGEAKSAAPKADKVQCNVTAQAFRKFSKQVWRLPAWRRGKPPKVVIRAKARKLRCAAGPGHRKAIKKRWAKDHRAFAKHRKRRFAARRLDALTPYGAYAIPAYIVACESHGDFRAYNAGYEPHGPGSGPGGAYQIIASTWAGYGGLAFAPTAAQASPLAQHIVAGRIWAAEGSSPWACA